jgi:DMSO reductase family type II enzyme heme b subunit
MAWKIGLSAAVIAGLAFGAAQQDPWEPEKKDPKFADVDWGYNQDTPIDPGMAPAGALLYGRYCIQCHGATGEGDGELAAFLIPPPRNFKRGVFKGRSSHPELPPCATDLMRSLVHGIPLSGMLSYSFLQTGDQQSLIAHVKSMAEDHFKKGFGFPLKSGNFHRALRMPFPTAETIARGRALFERFSCVACHGVNGDGKGPVTPTLSDADDGRPSNVRDFTQGMYSGGPNVRHMYLRISGGVQGTVMPPFATSISVEDRWALAQYVVALSKREEVLPLPHHEKLLVRKSAALPKGPADPEWAAIRKLGKPPEEVAPEGYPIQPFYILPIYLQQLRHNPARRYFTPAEVSALHDGKSIAFLVEWTDDARDNGDRFELQLSVKKEYGFALYGSPDDPVNLWRWEAGRPDAAAEFDAQGPFAVKPQKASDVTAAGNYDASKKRWSVVFSRPLAGTAGNDAPIPVDDEVPILFLMNDGGETWTESKRPVAPDPDADPAGAERAKREEEDRKKDEEGVRTKFKDLPRHFTTWHKFKLMNE